MGCCVEVVRGAAEMSGLHVLMIDLYILQMRVASGLFSAGFSMMRVDMNLAKSSRSLRSVASRVRNILYERTHNGERE